MEFLNHFEVIGNHYKGIFWGKLTNYVSHKREDEICELLLGRIKSKIDAIQITLR